MDDFFRFILNLIPRPWLIRLSTALSSVLNFVLKGDRYYDPINGRSYRAFLPYGYAKMRKNALAPGTLSLERHRLLWMFLKRDTDFFEAPLKVLHMAPEQCFYKRFEEMDNLDYTTADLYSPIAKVKADITSLPFPDNIFDVILCNHVLEHIPDDKKAMQELFRVMKPGGWGVFQVPMNQNKKETYENPEITSPKERKKHFGQYDHVRIYGRDYFDRLRSVGFLVEPKQPGLELEPEEIRKIVLWREEEIPFVRKS